MLMISKELIFPRKKLNAQKYVFRIPPCPSNIKEWAEVGNSWEYVKPFIFVLLLINIVVLFIETTANLLLPPIVCTGTCFPVGL